MPALFPSAAQNDPGLHVAIIMDGNGRWALRRGCHRALGHREGAKAVRRAVEAAPPLGISTLTLFAFSRDNWKRPAAEVNLLMDLFRAYLDSEVTELIRSGVRLSVIGFRDRIGAPLAAAIARAEEETTAGSALHLRLAIDYSSREAIVRAAAAGIPIGADSLWFAKRLGQECRAEDAPDVDLLIRTGGELRLSDFLLWESAYAELHFTPRMWPDFCAEDLSRAVGDFHRRERRFGALASGPEPERSLSPRGGGSS